MKRGWITGLDNIACYMNICRDTLIARMKKYDMPIVKVGRLWCAIESELDQWLTFSYKKHPKKYPKKPKSKILQKTPVKPL